MYAVGVIPTLLVKQMILSLLGDMQKKQYDDGKILLD